MRGYEHRCLPVAWVRVGHALDMALNSAIISMTFATLYKRPGVSLPQRARASQDPRERVAIEMQFRARGPLRATKGLIFFGS